MLINKNIISFFIFLVICRPALATIEQDQILQRQRQFENELLEIREQNEIKENRKQIEKESEDDLLQNQSGRIVQNLSSIQCFSIDQISFRKNDLLSKREEKKLVKEYLGKCISNPQIKDLLIKISNYLRKKGYITSYVSLPKQNLSSKKLEIKINESYVEEIILNNNDFKDKLQKSNAFAAVKIGEALNIKEIEQSLSQMNRLKSNKATALIIPGLGVGSSVIKVNNQPYNRSRIQFNYDNYGSQYTGKRREGITLSQDNLLWLNDKLIIGRIANDIIGDTYKERKNNYFYTDFSIPYSWYELDLFYSKSNYNFFLNGLRYSGEVSNKRVSLSRNLLRTKNIILSPKISLTSRNNLSFIQFIKLDNQSRKTTIFTLESPLTLFFKQSTLYIRPSLQRTLNILDSKKDPKSINSVSAHNEFKIFNLYGNYSSNFSIPYLESKANYNLIFNSQVSQQTLNGIDKFTVGGIYTVRGFNNGSIYGDSGYNIRNEININLGSLFSLIANKKELSSYTRQLYRLNIAPFYDYGYVRSKGGYQSGRLSGAGLKLSFQHKNINSSLTFSHSLSKSHLLLQNYKEDSAIYFDISSEIAFF